MLKICPLKYSLLQHRKCIEIFTNALYFCSVNFAYLSFAHCIKVKQWLRFYTRRKYNMHFEWHFHLIFLHNHQNITFRCSPIRLFLCLGMSLHVIIGGLCKFYSTYEQKHCWFFMLHLLYACFVTKCSAHILVLTSWDVMNMQHLRQFTFLLKSTSFVNLVFWT